MIRTTLFSALLLPCLLSPAFAGWNSSGDGDDFNNSHNPWFLRNTPKITYCVEIDAEGISAKPAKVEALVEKALSYWNDQFRKAGGGSSAGASFGTHEFVRKQSCDNTVDMRFQLGHGTLSPEQLAHLGDENRHIGIAVRTEYDSLQLRGKGFLYFASDLGANKLSTERFVETPWSYDGLLFRAIAHEVGHVFGIPHSGDGLMSETYLERILNKILYKQYVNADDVIDFFTPPLESEDCKISDAVASFFRAPKGSKCLYLRATPNDTSYRLAKVFTKDGNGKKILLGRIEASNKCVPTTGASPDIKVKLGNAIRLDEKQAVFSRTEIGIFDTFVLGPSSVEIGCAAVFKSRDGKKTPVYYRSGPGFHEILGLTDGAIQHVYNAKVHFMFGN